MSIRLMSAVFDSTTLKPTERLILLSLADHADDAGHCYPSIERLSNRTGLAERSVQTNIRKLVDQGYISIKERAGRNGSNLYIVRADPAADAPRSKCTPAAAAPQPRSSCTLYPAAAAPKPSVTIIEPSVVSKSARAISEALEQWVSPDAAASFIAYRKKHKSRGLTLTAANRLANSLSEIFNAGHDPTDALGMAEERGWASVNLDWYENAKGTNNDKRPATPNRPAHRPEHRLDPALTNCARLATIDEAPGVCGDGNRNNVQESGSVRVGARPRYASAGPNHPGMD